MQNGRFVQAGQFGHILDFIETRGIHFLNVVFVDDAFFIGFHYFHFIFIGTFQFDAGGNEAQCFMRYPY